MDLAGLREEDALELACRASLAVWTERRRGLVHAPLHWEWCELAQTAVRLCVVAPREHAKSETFTVNQTAWRCQYAPGMEAYVFGNTGDQAKVLKSRIDDAVEQTAPWMFPPREQNESMTVFANLSQVKVAGSGKGVRGEHPDLIVGDDVLEETTALTSYQRKKLARWWLGTVGGMAHPGTWRMIGGTRRWFGPTRVHLVGTPFHQQDLLLAMRDNPLYSFYRYAAEFDPTDLAAPGKSLALEIA
jgi:hypothetical protein